MRLRGTSITELEENGLDTDGAVESVSKLQSKIMALSGVNILTNTGEYKSTYEILAQISEVWQDIGDQDQAALLELIAGKRSGSVLAAILQNPQTLKDAFESANEASGSANKELEKYLDSIQGKLDQFTNATQTMWSNALDSDVVKFFVELGTTIVKVIDKIGLLHSALIVLATYSMIKNRMGPIAFLGEISNLIRKGASDVKTFIASMGGVATATSAVSVATLEESVANGALSASQAAVIATTNGLTMAKTSLTAAEAVEMLTSAGIAQADALEIATKLGLTKETTVLTAAKIQETIANSGLAVSSEVVSGALLGTGVAAKSAATGFAALLTALWPILAVMAGVAAIYGIVKLFDALIITTEELQEELDGLKSELSEIQSELSSVNSELETTQDRMAELLAIESLSFIEEEELENLKEQNDELERRQRLLEAEEERKKKETAEKTIETFNSQLSDKSYTGSVWDSIAGGLEGALLGAGGGAVAGSVVPGIGTAIGAIVGAIGGAIAGVGVEHATNLISTDSKLLEEMSNIENLSKQKAQLETELMSDGLSEKERNKKNEELEDLKEQLEESDEYIEDTLAELGETLSGVEYGYGADEQLDTYYNLRYRKNIADGVIGAEADGIEHILSRPEYEASQLIIKNAVEQFESGEIDKDSLMKTVSEQAQKATEDLEAMGLSAQDMVDYFTQIGEAAKFNTVEGKLEELKNATPKLQDLLSNKDTDIWESMFDNDGNVSKTAIAEYFQGTSEQTRTEIEKIVKAVNEGKMNVENALKQFELFGVEAVIDIEIEGIKEQFLNAFPELDADALGADGLISTFEELGNAISSTADALDVFNQAEADMADKGHVSIQTALKLMEYTDDYGSALEVVDGKLQLTEDAEDNLIEARLEAIKTSALKAYEEAEASHATAEAQVVSAEAAVSEYKNAIATEMSAEVVANAWQKVLASAAGLWEGIKSLFTGESWTDAYNRGYNDTLNSLADPELVAAEEANRQTTLRELEAGVESAKENAEETANEVETRRQNYELAETLTPDNLKDINDSSDKSTVEEVEEDAFQNTMDYWENQLSANQAKRDQIQNEIDLLEKQGKRAGEEYYKELIALEEERKAMLEAQRAEAIAYMNTQEEGSAEWWEAANIVNDLVGEIDDATASIQDYSDAMANIRWDNLEEITNRFSDLHDEISDLRDILQRNDMFDDDGNWTESGAAVLGTYVLDLEMYKNEIAELNEQIASFQNADGSVKQYAGNEDYYKTLGIDSEQEWNDRYTELTQQQRDYVKSAYDTADAIADAYSQQVDAIESAIEKQIDAYNDYIDVVKESLDAERDLYEFKKSIANETKKQAELERKIASLSGSTNAADIAERRKLEKD